MIKKIVAVLKSLFLILMLCIVGKGYAQKEPQYTQYMYNIGSFNPAYVGTVEHMELAGLYRAQWVDIPGAPRTVRFGMNLPFANQKTGLGFNVVSDALGPTTQTYIDVAYSYQINVSDNTKLSFGIDAGGAMLDVDYTKGDFEEENEPLILNSQFNKFYPTVGGGLFLYSDNWYLGASIPNFMTSIIDDEEVTPLVNDEVQFNVIGGYVFDLSDNLKFKPAFLLHQMSGTPLKVDVSSNFLINDALVLGAAYRFNTSVSALAGVQINNKMFLGYSYDYNTNGLGQYNSGSHEAILKFYLGTGVKSVTKTNERKLKGKPKQIDTPRFF